MVRLYVQFSYLWRLSRTYANRDRAFSHAAITVIHLHGDPVDAEFIGHQPDNGRSFSERLPSTGRPLVGKGVSIHIFGLTPDVDRGSGNSPTHIRHSVWRCCAMRSQICVEPVLNTLPCVR